MKNYNLFFCVALVLTLFSTPTFAQYKHAIGGRFGTANGISYKTFVNTNNALEFIANFQSSNSYSYFRFTGLMEKHVAINDVDGLRWYYGFGATVGSRKYKPTDENDLLLAVDGILGLDFKFPDAPINIALDWKPALEVSPNTRLNGEGAGLSLRFTF
ncbi:MAG: hypothetical protein ACKOWL_03140 [Sphingobacteriaceae bacterium]